MRKKIICIIAILLLIFLIITGCIRKDIPEQEENKTADKISEQNLGTPLITMGDNYVMGWGTEQQRDFNRYVKNFTPKSKL